MTSAIYPGRFDPVTLGHLDIIQRASKLFDSLIVAVYETPPQQSLFTTEERQFMLRESIVGLPTVSVESFHGLVVNYAKVRGAQVMVRGLRMSTDFEYEFEMALMNRKLDPDLEVVCLMARLEYQFVRASLLKEVARLEGDVSGLAPPNVITALRHRFNGKV